MSSSPLAFRTFFTDIEEMPGEGPVMAEVTAGLYETRGVDTHGKRCVQHNVVLTLQTAACQYGLPVVEVYREFFRDTPDPSDLLAHFVDSRLFRVMPLGSHASPARFMHDLASDTPEQWAETRKGL